jgi:Fe2+ or Zn2+ uptake regulation protein
MKEDLSALLHSYKYKVTPTRVSILSVFSKDCDPLCVQDVHKKTKIDVVTIYRTLTSFEKKGLLRHVGLHKDSVYYERNDTDHHHIICLSCKKFSDFKGCGSKEFIHSALSQTKDFTSISHHSFDLFGLCNSCTKK